MAPLILHNVPDDELYVGDDGVKRPYAMIFNQYVRFDDAACAHSLESVSPSPNSKITSHANIDTEPTERRQPAPDRGETPQRPAPLASQHDAHDHARGRQPAAPARTRPWRRPTSCLATGLTTRPRRRRPLPPPRTARRRRAVRSAPSSRPPSSSSCAASARRRSSTPPSATTRSWPASSSKTTRATRPAHSDATSRICATRPSRAAGTCRPTSAPSSTGLTAASTGSR